METQLNLTVSVVAQDSGIREMLYIQPIAKQYSAGKSVLALDIIIASTN